MNTLLRQRWLIYVLVTQELKLRYRGSVIGFFWTLLNPLVFMIIYTLVFSVFLRIDIEKYSVFVLSGLIPWIWFTEAIARGTNSIISGGGFIKSSLFPSEVLPATPVASAMINFVFALPLLFLFLGLFRVDLGWSLLALPVVMAVQFMLALGIVLITATYNVFFRDLQFLVNHILLALFFLTPILYDLSIIPERFHTIMMLNPLTTLIDSYRSIFFYGSFPDWVNLGYLFLLALMLFWLGSWVFARHKEVFAEYL